MTEARIHSVVGRVYYPALDGLRAIAVLLVVGFHAAVPGDAAFRRGSYGVQIFFAISGMLITTLVLDERRRTGRIDLKAFYRRRTARIFPLYYLVLGLYCLLVWATQHGPDAEAFWNNLPAFATYTANWAVDHRADGGRVIFLFAWSLAVEEQFYLVWPSALVWLKRWAPIALLGAVVPHPYYFAAIALGCFVALWLDDPRFRSVLRGCATPGLAAGAVVILLAIPIKALRENVWVKSVDSNERRLIAP